MLLSVEQAFVGSECNPISTKNDCVGGYGVGELQIDVIYCKIPVISPGLI